MENLSIILIFILFLCFWLLSKRIDGSMLTPPMIFVGAGLLLSEVFFGTVDFHVGDDPLHLLLESTLVLVLFSDAARIYGAIAATYPACEENRKTREMSALARGAKT